jgi:hypothetical protein
MEQNKMTNNNEQTAWQELCERVGIEASEDCNGSCVVPDANKPCRSLGLTIEYVQFKEKCTHRPNPYHPTPTADMREGLEELILDDHYLLSKVTYCDEDDLFCWSDNLGTGRRSSYGRTRLEAICRLLTGLCNTLGDEFKKQVKEVIEG